jgi:hypothetical protein
MVEDIRAPALYRRPRHIFYRNRRMRLWSHRGTAVRMHEQRLGSWATVLSAGVVVLNLDFVTQLDCHTARDIRDAARRLVAHHPVGRVALI